MENVALTNVNVPVNIAAPARGLAKIAPKFLTLNVNAGLGLAAFGSLMLYAATGEHPLLMLAALMAWALHLAAWATADITEQVNEKKVG